MQELLDLANLPRLHIEIDLLKKLLLSKKQRKAIELLGIPKIIIDSKFKIIETNFTLFEIAKSGAFDIEGYFQNLVQKANCSKIEKRLTSLMKNAY